MARVRCNELLAGVAHLNLMVFDHLLAFYSCSRIRLTFAAHTTKSLSHTLRTCSAMMLAPLRHQNLDAVSVQMKSTGVIYR